MELILTVFFCVKTAISTRIVASLIQSPVQRCHTLSILLIRGNHCVGEWLSLSPASRDTTVQCVVMYVLKCNGRTYHGYTDNVFPETIQNLFLGLIR